MEVTIGQLGWLAGVFDCDSCIFITRSKRENRPTPYNYRVEVTVEGTDPRKPYECYRLTGVGSIWREKVHPEGSPKSNTVKWRMRGSDAIKILQQVCPHMINKKEQAELAIEFASHLKSHWTEMLPEDYAFQEWAYYEMPRIKKRHALGRTLWVAPNGEKRMHSKKRLVTNTTSLTQRGDS